MREQSRSFVWWMASSRGVVALKALSGKIALVTGGPPDIADEAP
jgi:hypothetical protein